MVMERASLIQSIVYNSFWGFAFIHVLPWEHTGRFGFVFDDLIWREQSPSLNRIVAETGDEAIVKEGDLGGHR